MEVQHPAPTPRAEAWTDGPSPSPHPCSRPSHLASVCLVCVCVGGESHLCFIKRKKDNHCPAAHKAIREATVSCLPLESRVRAWPLGAVLLVGMEAQSDFLVETLCWYVFYGSEEGRE